jgi:crotonobetainyl-CoA:carnitine CoA-transferase CaiB-like acyl-CoA transferase
VAVKRAAATPPLTSEEARQQAQAEKLTLLLAENKTGYFGVHLNKPGKPKPYQVQVTRGGKSVSLGCFATAEEAALCVARTPEGRAVAAERAAAAPLLTSEEARQQAQAEKLTLVVAKNSTGYFGVSLVKPGTPKPYQAQVSCGAVASRRT